MDIQILRTFLELDRTRHFGKAAEALFVTQSAVSARIRLLEQTLGVSLFIRRRNEIRLTGAGERLKRHAETIVAAWQRALADAALDEEHKLALSVGGIHTLWDCFLQEWIHTLYKHRPDIALQAEAHGPEALNKKVADGGLDVAFLFEPAHLEQLAVSEVASIPLVMVASRPALDARIAIKDGYVMVEWGAAFAAAYARHFPDAPLPTMRMSIARTALTFLLECGGSSYLPEQLVAEHLKAGRLYKVSDAPIIDRRVYAVYQGHGERRGFVEEALGYLKEKVLPQVVQSSSVG
jgi:DNA-binding transcriptional LysR family regulator